MSPADLPPITIPFNRANLAGDETSRVLEAIALGHISGDGRFTKVCHQMLEQALGVPKVLLTTSCTHALEMSALLLDLKPGDEVILPSFTFVSTANAFALHGAIPRFADITPDTLCIDVKSVERLLTPRTRAIVPVHYAGVGCEMDELMSVAKSNGLMVIEDNAHGLFGQYKGRQLGTFGELSTLSFHETKNFTCGEGGALVINDRKLIDRAELIREKGTNRSRFFRGQVDKYTWVDLGSSYLPSDILAAFLSAQLEKRHFIQNARRTIWNRYDDELRGWASKHGVRQPVVPAHCEQAYHMYYLLMPSLDIRTAFIEHLRQCGILAVFHYVPLHRSEMGSRFGGDPDGCPITDGVSERLVRLPLYVTLSEVQQAQVIDAVRRFKLSHGDSQAARGAALAGQSQASD